LSETNTGKVFKQHTNWETQQRHKHSIKHTHQLCKWRMKTAWKRSQNVTILQQLKTAQKQKWQAKLLQMQTFAKQGTLMKTFTCITQTNIKSFYDTSSSSNKRNKFCS